MRPAEDDSDERVWAFCVLLRGLLRLSAPGRLGERPLAESCLLR